MKIFAFIHTEGETDWVSAPNKEEAIEFYERETDSLEEDTVVEEIPQDKWKEMYLLDTDGYFDSESIPEGEEDSFVDGYKIIMNFEEFMKAAPTTEIIATTAF